MAHARFAPSGAHRWMRCPGSLVLTDKAGDRSSGFADEGSAAHEFAAWLLLNRPSVEEQEAAVDVMFTTINGKEYFLTKDMLGHIRDYAKLVDEYAAGGELLVEERVHLSEVMGTPDCYGTSDAIILHEGRIVVVDLKYGMGVKVDAFKRTDAANMDTIPNEQMALYALGALETFDYMIGDIERVTLVVHQPRLNHVSEYECSIGELQDFALRAKGARITADTARKQHENPTGDLKFEDFLHPGEEQCRFCSGKASCPALRKQVDDTVDDDFRDMLEATHIDADQLSEAMKRVGMVEDWCKGVRAEVERRLLSGQPVKDFKLVQGRQGNRAWSDAKEAEALLKSFRLKQDEMYTFSLISPTTAEKLLATASPKRWDKAKALITRADGKPSVAPATDPRPEMVITPVSDDFADLTQTEN